MFAHKELNLHLVIPLFFGRMTVMKGKDSVGKPLAISNPISVNIQLRHEIIVGLRPNYLFLFVWHLFEIFAVVVTPIIIRSEVIVDAKPVVCRIGDEAHHGFVA